MHARRHVSGRDELRDVIINTNKSGRRNNGHLTRHIKVEALEIVQHHVIGRRVEEFPVVHGRVVQTAAGR